MATYGYDADGQRIRKQTPSGTTHYLIDATTTWPQVVLERTQDPTGQATQSTAYVWGNELRQQVRGGQGTLFGNPAESLNALQGHLGTTIAAVNASGQAVEAYEATAFGEPGNATPKLKHQYTGEYWDQEVGATYLRARWYEAGSGRFAGLDPRAGRQADPRSLNRYTYAHMDPTEYVDPSGAESLMSVSTALAVIGVGITSYSAATDVMNGNYGSAVVTVAIGATLGTAINAARVALAAKEAYVGIGATGKVGENFLKALGGQPQAYFPTTLGKRYIDQLINGIAHESKVGATSLTSRVQLQILKDMELIQTTEIIGSTWHFFRSPVTGLIGPSGPLIDALKQAGIKFIIH